MAGMFYSKEEAAEKLGVAPEQLEKLVEEGKLREFRDGSHVLFKVDEIDMLVSDESVAAPAEISVEPQQVEEITSQADVPELEPEQAAEEIMSDTNITELDASLAEPAEQPDEQVESVMSDTDITAELTGTSAKSEQPAEMKMSDTDITAELADTSAESEQPVEMTMSDTDIMDLGDTSDQLQPQDSKEVAPELSDTELGGFDETFVGSELSDDKDDLSLASGTSASSSLGDLGDGDTVVADTGINVLGESASDYEITDDILGETRAGASQTSGALPDEASLEEIEGDVNLDTFGSGSGLLDLSLQADDTSLGGILDEIYTSESEEGQGTGGASGLEAAVEGEQMLDGGGAQVAMPGMTRAYAEAPADTVSNALGIMLLLPFAAVIYSVIVIVAAFRGIAPSIREAVQSIIWYIVIGAAVASSLIAVGAMLVSSPSGEKKEKKVKAKKEKKPKKEKKAKKGKK